MGAIRARSFGAYETRLPISVVAAVAWAGKRWLGR